MSMKKLFYTSLFILCCSMSCQESPDPAPEPYVLEYPEQTFGEPILPEDNPLTKEGVQLGRMLFYEKLLSKDNQISCASCHQQNKAFTDGRKISKGIGGQLGDFNAMSITNMAWTSRFFWNGRAVSLEEQALEPIEHPKEMGLSLEEAEKKIQNARDYAQRFQKVFGSSKVTAENIAKALAQFQRTLISSNSKYDRYWAGEAQFTQEEQLGFELFFQHPEPMIQLRGANCGDCHDTFQLKGFNDGFSGFHNNGLDSDADLPAGLMDVTNMNSDRGKFKTPTLRNIALTAPYMHDGRFQTLEEVLDHYNEHVKMSETLSPLMIVASNEVNPPQDEVKLFLTENEKKAVIAFLHTLTDTTFVNDGRFSNPFE
jgi:cytochrome c peroxidase